VAFFSTQQEGFNDEAITLELSGSPTGHGYRTGEGGLHLHHPLDPPDSRSTNMNGSGINASGLIVGDYLDADTRTHGYLLSGGATLHSTFPARP